jgi:3-oxoadipate enol-lactonase
MHIDANGIACRVEVDGQNGGPAVMLSHSLMLDVDMWQPQLAALAARYRVIRYDTRGHGGTGAPASSFTLADLADDVDAILTQLDIDSVHFVGLSMGGMIGQQLAIRHPHRVRSLVLANTLSAYGPQAMPMWQSRIDAASGPQGIEPLVEPTVTRWFTDAFRAANSDTLDWVRKLIRRTSVAGYIECCKALMKLDLTASLPRVQVPALVIAGRQDPSTPVAGSEVIARALPAAQLAIIEDAAHISNIEQPKVFESLLLTFLDRQVQADSRQ